MRKTNLKKKKPIPLPTVAKKRQPADVCVFSGMQHPLPAIEHETQNAPIIDRLLHASMAKVSGLSPAALATAWFDWAAHLAIAPGKQAELAKSAGEKAALLSTYVSHRMLGCEKPECCVDPQPQDRRFRDEGWQDWPYSLYQQAFLLTEQWWQEVTGSVRGVTRHHSDVVPFLTRQWLDMFSPLNFPFTNPRVVQDTAAGTSSRVRRTILTTCRG